MTGTAASPAGPAQRLGETIDALKDVIRNPRKMSTGEVAELRRFKPEGKLGPAFWKLRASVLIERGELIPLESGQEEREQRWAIILAGLARLEGPDVVRGRSPRLHSGEVSLGTALSRAEFDPKRLDKLLEVEGHALHVNVLQVATVLAQKGQVANWTDAAALVLSDGAEWAEGVRRRIARNFYQAEHQRLDPKGEADSAPKENAS